MKYQAAVNALDRTDGSPEGRAQIRAEIERLRQETIRRREAEIDLLKQSEAANRSAGNSAEHRRD